MIDSTIQRDIIETLNACDNVHNIKPFIVDHMVTRLEIVDCHDMWYQIGLSGDMSILTQLFNLYGVDPSDVVDRLLFLNATVSVYRGAMKNGHMSMMTYLANNEFYIFDGNQS